MKILLIAPLSRPEMTGHIIKQAFLDLGFNVETFDYRAKAVEFGISAMNESLLDKVRGLNRTDIALILKGELLEPLIFDAEKCIRALWYFDFDAVEPPKYLVALGRCVTSTFLTCYPWVDPLRDLGINAFFLPQATDPLIYRKTEFDPGFASDVAFIGTKKPGREEFLKKLNSRFDLKVWGEQWQDSELKPGIPAYIENFNKICSSAKIIINITSSDDYPSYMLTLSQKIFMILAAEGFLLNDSILNIHSLFEIDKELILYNNLDDLSIKIGCYLKQDKLRARIAHAGRMRILKEHTYIHRLRRMFECLGLLLSVQRNIQE